LTIFITKKKSQEELLIEISIEIFNHKKKNQIMFAFQEIIKLGYTSFCSVKIYHDLNVDFIKSFECKNLFPTTMIDNLNNIF
jgi:hypothetical protein